MPAEIEIEPLISLFNKINTYWMCTRYGAAQLSVSITDFKISANLYVYCLYVWRALFVIIITSHLSLFASQ